MGSAGKRRQEQGGPTAAEKPAHGETGSILLFTTRTCPLCQRAEKMLVEAGIGYRKILAEEEPELAKKYSIHQAPTLVIGEGTQGDFLQGIAAIKQFADAHMILN